MRTFLLALVIAYLVGCLGGGDDLLPFGEVYHCTYSEDGAKSADDKCLTDFSAHEHVRSWQGDCALRHDTEVGWSCIAECKWSGFPVVCIEKSNP